MTSSSSSGPRLLPAKVAAQQMGIPYTTLRDLVFRGSLPVVRLGRAWYFDVRELEQLIVRQTHVHERLDGGVIGRRLRVVNGRLR